MKQSRQKSLHVQQCIKYHLENSIKISLSIYEKVSVLRDIEIKIIVTIRK